jgi:Type II secretion system (T2SS), protein M subtype b
MQNFQLQKRLIIAGLAVLLLADAALGYFTMRMWDVRQNPDATIATQSRQVSLVKADITRASNIQKKIPAYLQGLDEFENSLAASTAGYSAVSQEMSEVAQKNHVAIDDEKFHQKDVPGRNLTEVEIETSVGGDYANIVRFLNALQRSKSVYIIDSLQVESQSVVPGQPALGNLRVNLHLRTYFRKANG